jgi:hypothetical protein
MPGDRVTSIRLPLQIGTSSLWSVARASAFFPGLLLLALGVYSGFELFEVDGKLALAVGGALAVAGGVLTYYAYRHTRLALDERPSDVLIDERGIAVQGGARDGLSLAWSEIDPARCSLETVVEERLVLWRAIVNIPLIAISVVGESGELMMDFTEKTPVKRLFVARRSASERILFAEGDLPIEESSLQALLATIRSSRWHDRPAPVDANANANAPEPAPKGRKKKKHQQPPAPEAPKREREIPSPVLCANCGAAIAPAATATVTCRFCSHSVAMPEDARQRVHAAEALAKDRSSGYDKLLRLLESQPSAGHAMTAITLAAIPIALAWPVAIVLGVRAFDPTVSGARHLGGLAVFPILLTFAAFLLARARMTDRFALHAVVIGFGARQPARPGEPYRCRACEAALPDTRDTPIVRCVYCSQPSVIGLDLRADARAAAEEAQSLEHAFAARTRERWLWSIGSVAALGLVALAWLSVKPSLRTERPKTPAGFALAPVERWDKGAPRFKDVALHAKLTSANAAIPFDASSCELFVAPSGLVSEPCRVRFVCDGRDAFGGELPRTCYFGHDHEVRTFDETVADKRFLFDLQAQTATLSSRAEGASYEAAFSFDPKARAVDQPRASSDAGSGAATVAFAPIDRTAVVVSSKGRSPVTGTTCKLHVAYLDESTCRASLTCGGKRVYGTDRSTTACTMVGTGVTLADTRPTPQDYDPIFILGSDGVLELSDVTDGGSYTVKLRVTP